MYPLKQTHSSSWLLSSSSSLQQKPAQKPCLPITTNSYSFAKNGSVIKSSVSLSTMDTNSNNSPVVLISPENESPFHKLKQKSSSSSANSCPLTPIEFLERAAVVYGDSLSILYNDTSRTWSEIHLRCLKLASSIVSLGIKKNDVVSVVAPNVPAMCELHFAVPMAAAILNTVNLRLDANAISNLLQHSGSKLVFVDYQSAFLVEDAVSLFPANLQRPGLVIVNDDSAQVWSSSMTTTTAMVKIMMTVVFATRIW